MSLELFRARPDLYLRGVARAWVDFWKMPYVGYWDLSKVTSPGLRHGLQRAWAVQRWLLIGANATFLAGAAIVVGALMLRRGPPPSSFSLVAIALVLSASVGQALTEYGENARYAVPFQPLILCTVMVWGWLVTRAFLARLPQPQLIHPPASS